MTLRTDPATLIDMASGVPLILLGLWLASLRPRRRGTLALACVSVANGVVAISANLADPFDPLHGPLLWLSLVAFAGVLALAFMLRTLPRPLGPEDQTPLRRSAAAGAAVALLGLTPYAFDPAGAWAVTATSDPASVAPLALTVPVNAAVTAVYVAYLLLLAQRSARAAADEGALRQDALMTAGLVLLLAYNQGFWALAPHPAIWLPAALTVAAYAAAAALWLRGTARRGGRAARVGRNAALVCLGVPAAGMAGTVMLGGYENAGYGPFGVVRMFAVLVLAYAVLRHQLLGIDVKARWTIRQSTVAAAFIGVFFVASEGAQAFFGAAADSEWLGIAAAGLLVFAIAPLQRAAERVASVAVPAAGPAAAIGGEPAREAQYRVALRVALRDGRLSAEEAVSLAALAESLGLGAAAYERIRREVAEELSTERAPRRPRRPEP